MGLCLGPCASLGLGMVLGSGLGFGCGPGFVGMIEHAEPGRAPLMILRLRLGHSPTSSAFAQLAREELLHAPMPQTQPPGGPDVMTPAYHDAGRYHLDPGQANCLEVRLAAKGGGASIHTTHGAAHDPPRTRTWNLRLQRPTPYPLGKQASCGFATII